MAQRPMIAALGAGLLGVVLLGTSATGSTFATWTATAEVASGVTLQTGALELEHERVGGLTAETLEPGGTTSVTTKVDVRVEGTHLQAELTLDLSGLTVPAGADVTVIAPGRDRCVGLEPVWDVTEEDKGRTFSATITLTLPGAGGVPRTTNKDTCSADGVGTSDDREVSLGKARWQLTQDGAHE